MCKFLFKGQGRKSEASHAMAIFRGDLYDPNDELATMQSEAESNASRKSSVFDLIKTPGNRRAVMASFGGMAFQQLSGVNAVIFYTVTIFEAAGSDLDPDLAAIIVALVQVSKEQTTIDPFRRIIFPFLFVSIVDFFFLLNRL